MKRRIVNAAAILSLVFFAYFSVAVARATFGPNVAIRWPPIHFWVVWIASGLLPIIWLRSRPGHQRDGHCRRCGYDLRATPERCPECGYAPQRLDG
jgi:hypothetical protein